MKSSGDRVGGGIRGLKRNGEDLEAGSFWYWGGGILGSKVVGAVDCGDALGGGEGEQGVGRGVAGQVG